MSDRVKPGVSASDTSWVSDQQERGSRTSGVDVASLSEENLSDAAMDDLVDGDFVDHDLSEEDAENLGDGPPRAGVDLLPESARRRGRGWRWLVALILVFAMAGGGAAWWQSRSDAPAPAPVSQTRPEQSLFIAVSTPDNKVVDGLYYVEADDAATALFVPGDLMADVPTRGTVPFSESLSVGTDAPGVTFADATGLRVDATWALPMDAMASLIDKVGGISVDVDVPVQTEAVTLAAGNQQKLNGPQAMTFATWSRNGEAGSSQLSRLGQVTTTLIAALPEEASEVEAWLAQVPGSTTLEPSELATRLVWLRNALHGNDFSGALLPVQASATPEVPTGVTVDVPALRSWAAARLEKLTMFTPGEAGVVALQNATGVEKLDLDARRTLTDEGYAYQWKGIAEPVQPTTIVMVPTNSAEDLAAGRTVAEALGVPGAQVVGSPIVTTSQVALVLLGADFIPEGAQQPAAAGEAPADEAAEAPQPTP